MFDRSLVPPADPEEEYVPPPEVLRSLPDARARGESPPDVQFSVENWGPVLCASKIRDIRILRGLLQHGFPPTNYIVGPLSSPWNSALTNAVLAGPDFDDHVKLLIEHGANPNGFPSGCYKRASTRFIRGRNVDDTWTSGCYLRSWPEAVADVRPSQLVTNPMTHLTEDELQNRYKSRSRFWAEPEFPLTDYPTNNPASSLSAAIEANNTAIYEYLTAHGADETAWIDGQKYHLLTDDLPPSYFTVESPMFIAIMKENKDALQFLLNRGHKPDIFPTALITRCLNPIMITISKPRRPWLDGFHLLAPYADLSLLTPIFHCHLLHFAMATHDLALIKHVINTCGGPASIRDIAYTALGHTLLHIASLPIDEPVVNMHSQKIHLSIHEFRTTNEWWKPMHLAATLPPRQGGLVRGRSGSTRDHYSWRVRFRPMAFRDLSPEEHEAQAAVLLYLLDSGAIPLEQLAEQDVHGNTVLHYLVSVRNPNYDIIKKLRDRTGTKAPPEPIGTHLWSRIKNIHGITAEDLDMDGRAARAKFTDRDLMPFWSNE